MICIVMKDEFTKKILQKKIANINCLLIQETLNKKITDNYIKKKVFDKILEHYKTLNA